MELNLRPASVVRQHQLAERRPFIITAGVCLLLMLAGWWLYYDHAAAATEVANETLTPEVNRLKDVENRMNAVRADIKAQQDAVAPMIGSVEERDYWVKVINDINSRLPAEYVWVTAFEPHIATPSTKPTSGSSKGAPKQDDTPKGPQTVLTLRGLYLSNPAGPSVLDEFLGKLRESDLYTVPKGGFKSRSTPNDAEWAYDFEVELTLKNPIQIPQGSTLGQAPK
jgi:Tfp pilus assembly protein PilN